MLNCVQFLVCYRVDVMSAIYIDCTYAFDLYIFTNCFMSLIVVNNNNYGYIGLH